MKIKELKEKSTKASAQTSTKVVIIQTSIKDKLASFIENYNQSHNPKLKLDYAVFFISLFNSLPSYNRDENNNDIVALSSQKLKKYHYEYTKYVDLLIKWGFIKMVNNYSADHNCTKEYKLNEEYLQSDIQTFTITDSTLLKKFDRYGRDSELQKKSAHCKKFRPHLVKNFNNKLSIDSLAAYESVKPMLFDGDKRNSAITALQLIMEFHFKQWNYSIKESTDNRLHSNLTRTPRIIRKFLNYNGQALAGIDLKTSQPYFLLVIIKSIVTEDIDTLREIGVFNLLSEDMFEELISLDLNKENLREFYRNIKDKDFYNEFLKQLDIKYNDQGFPIRNVFNEQKSKKAKRRTADKSSRKTIVYDSERELVKKVIMEIFYSSPNSKTKEAAIFRKMYPEVHKIIKYFFEKEIKLHRLLQNVEAEVLLDKVALEISDSYPEMPIFSIHDSLVTTTEWIDVLEDAMNDLIKKITTIAPKLEVEIF